MKTKQEFEDEVKKEFPRFFELLNKPIDEFNGPFEPIALGLDVGPGWYTIVYDAARLIEDINVTRGTPPIQAVQVKEKFGGLRLYTNFCTPEVDKVIEAAEAKASVTCEKCGQSGELRQNGWWVTLCNDCNDKRHQG